MPSIAEQLRTARHRRARRRQGAVAVLAVALTAVVGPRLVDLASADLASSATDPVTTVAEPPASVDTTSGTGITAGSAPTALDPGLVAAFERARASAAGADHELTITSGFRTAAEQAALLDAEVEERGSLEEARWWVFPPDRSMHVQGLAIDVADGPAADWLAREGARFGLCRTLDWEWWHFEWRQRWQEAGTCPEPAAHPADAPRT